MHGCQRPLFEGDRYELLCVYIVEPIREGPICSSEHLLVVIDGLLVTLVVVGCSQSCQMSEIGKRVLAPALACVDGCHRTPFIHTLDFVSLRNYVVGSLLKV